MNSLDFISSGVISKGEERHGEREREREREREVSDYYYHSDSKCATIISTLIVHVKSLVMILHLKINHGLGSLRRPNLKYNPATQTSFKDLS